VVDVFLKIEKLKDDIKSGYFTEKDRFVYALIYFVSGVIGLGF